MVTELISLNRNRDVTDAMEGSSSFPFFYLANTTEVAFGSNGGALLQEFHVGKVKNLVAANRGPAVDGDIEIAVAT